MNKSVISFFNRYYNIPFSFSSYALQIDEKINEILNPISVFVVSIVFSQ